MLDKDHKGRLTQQNLAPAVTAQDFTGANPDGTMTIGAKEWFGLVRRHFYAADPDNDGSLLADELKTPAGQALLRLVQQPAEAKRVWPGWRHLLAGASPGA